MNTFCCRYNNKTMPIQSERANYSQVLSMFFVILLRNIALYMQKLLYCIIFKLKVVRLKQTSYHSYVRIFSWIIFFSNSYQNLHCITPPVSISLNRWIHGVVFQNSIAGLISNKVVKSLIVLTDESHQLTESHHSTFFAFTAASFSW